MCSFPHVTYQSKCLLWIPVRKTLGLPKLLIKLFYIGNNMRRRDDKDNIPSRAGNPDLCNFSWTSGWGTDLSVLQLILRFPASEGMEAYLCYPFFLLLFSPVREILTNTLQSPSVFLAGICDSHVFQGITPFL